MWPLDSTGFQELVPLTALLVYCLLPLPTEGIYPQHANVIHTPTDPSSLVSEQANPEAQLKENCVCFHNKRYHNKSYEQDEVELTTCVQWQVNFIIRYIYTTNTY